MKSLGSVPDRDAMLARLRAIRPDSARRWGRMTAPEMICHLADSFRCALGEREVSHVGGMMHRTAVKWIALYAPVRWPRSTRTRPELNPHRSGTRPGEFAADLAELEQLFRRFAAHRTPAPWPPHPFFGRMSDNQWHRWGYLHTDHHLRQFGA